MNLTYSNQLEYKKNKLQDILNKYGFLKFVAEDTSDTKAKLWGNYDELVSETRMLITGTSPVLTIDDLASNVFEKGYSQSQEFEADSKALQLMAVAGYNPNAMVKMLEKIKQKESSTKGMKNHPSAELRIANVQLRLKFLKNNSTGEQLRNKRFTSVYTSF